VSAWMTLLREDLLRGLTILLAGGVRSQLQDALVGLGASVEVFDMTANPDDEGAERWARGQAPVHALVFDARRAFGDGAQPGLQAALQDGWTATRGVAAGALIPGQRGGRIVLLAPRPDAGAYAGAARSALENLARTLSVEWARHRITSSVIAPGPATTDEHMAALVAFLLSPAGGYFSGCRFELGAVTTRGRRSPAASH
jgi:NAD(P)-dependent dehydrogenase (short-subunit alcohol dehydrogenase family)